MEEWGKTWLRMYADMNETLGKVIGYFNAWLTKTPPLRKFFDVLVLSVGLLIGGTLYVAYQRVDALLALVSRSLSHYPVLDMQAAERGWEAMYAVARKSGAFAVELYAVDMARNTITLMRIEGDDDAVSHYGPAGKTRSFLIPGLGEEQMAEASAIITGDCVVGPRWVRPEHTGLYIPIPDHPGQLLAGILVLTFDQGTPREQIVAARGGLLAYTESLTTGQ